MPYRDADGAMQAIRHAREKRKPFLGTSAGFQYAVIEFARNVLGLAQADHQKTNPKAAMPLISPLGLSLLGVKARVRFTEGSHLRQAYRTPGSIEEYHCSFGLNDSYRALFESGAMRITAMDENGEPRGIELQEHPFFVATLFQPERAGLHGQLHPLVNAFVRAAFREAGIAASV